MNNITSPIVPNPATSKAAIIKSNTGRLPPPGPARERVFANLRRARADGIAGGSANEALALAIHEEEVNRCT